MDHIVTSDRIVCGNCGIQIKPDPIKEEGSCRPLEAIVEDDDRIRELQYKALRAGMEPRHSVAIAASKPVAFAERDWRGSQ